MNYFCLNYLLESHGSAILLFQLHSKRTLSYLSDDQLCLLQIWAQLHVGPQRAISASDDSFSADDKVQWTQPPVSHTPSQLSLCNCYLYEFRTWKATGGFPHRCRLGFSAGRESTCEHERNIARFRFAWIQILPRNPSSCTNGRCGILDRGRTKSSLWSVHRRYKKKNFPASLTGG